MKIENKMAEISCQIKEGCWDCKMFRVHRATEMLCAMDLFIGHFTYISMISLQIMNQDLMLMFFVNVKANTKHTSGKIEWKLLE